MAMMDRQVAVGSSGIEASPVSDGELISAWMDGELGPDDAVALLERVEADPALRERWTWLHVVQDAVRSHDVAAMASLDCDRRVDLALQSEPAYTRRGGLGRSALRHLGLQGLALAAGVAVVIWIAVPLLRAPDDGKLASEPMPVVPAVATALKGPSDEGRGENLSYYLQAHSDLADGGLMSAAALMRASYAEER
jgi:negative regulator of sigma E activity